MRIFLLLAFIFLEISSLKAADENWPVSTIPAELKAKANAIVRLSEVTLTVSESGKTEEDNHFVITIMNENGNPFGNLVEYYDKYTSIWGLEGTVYDQNGKKIKRINADEFLDFSAISGFSIYEDNRVKYANPRVGNYPYTVEYRFQKKYKKFMALPSWSVYMYYNIAVQKSIFSLVYGTNTNVIINGNEKFNIKPEISENKGVKTTTWKVENLAAIEEEPFSESFLKVSPILRIAPETFEMDGFKGTNKSWAEFGNWSTNLCQGRDSLPQTTVDKLKSIVANAKTDKEKARLLYEYMQNKVRYVSIQVGIGGWQPFPAETVDRLSYGDCKALTNYMKTLLRYSGIKSYYCLVRAGDDAPNIDKDFVCSQFNHAFLMIPFDKDTLYLECTSQLNPFGYNGSFTDDRDVLVIDGMNSFIKHTNIYKKDQNKVVKNVNIQIDDKLSCTVDQTNKYFGVATEYYRFLMQAQPDKQREVVLKKLDYKQVKIKQLNYSEKKDFIPEIEEKIQYNVASIAQLTSSNTMIFPFNQVALLSDLKRVSNRKSNVEIRRDEIEIDSINYEIPKGVKVEKLPISGSFSSLFGSYKLEVSSTGNRILFIRKIEWNKSKFEPEKYSELIQYQKKVNEMDRQVIILKPV